MFATFIFCSASASAWSRASASTCLRDADIFCRDLLLFCFAFDLVAVPLAPVCVISAIFRNPCASKTLRSCNWLKSLSGSSDIDIVADSSDNPLLARS